jgi:hypothetical protein
MSIDKNRNLTVQKLKLPETLRKSVRVLSPTADDIKAHQIQYTYNEDGNLSKVSYPTTKDGIQSLSYIYDENGWLQEIEGELHSKGQTTEKVLRSYTYDAYGKVKEIKNYRNRYAKKNGRSGKV